MDEKNRTELAGTNKKNESKFSIVWLRTNIGLSIMLLINLASFIYLFHAIDIETKEKALVFILWLLISVLIGIRFVAETEVNTFLGKTNLSASVSLGIFALSIIVFCNLWAPVPFVFFSMLSIVVTGLCDEPVCGDGPAG